MASDVRAGGAFVELLLRDKSFIRGLAASGRKLQAFGKVAFKVGAAITTSFGAAAAVFAKVGDSLNKMALRTGFSVQALSELKFAAQQSGTSIEIVEKAIKTMQKGLVDAERGLSTATDNLDDLGLSLDSFAGKSPEEQFEIFAARIASIEDPSRRAALAMMVFGKAGAALLPLLSDGVQGMNALRQEARDLGITMDDDTAAGAAALTDALGRIKEQLKFVVVNIGAAIAGPLTKFFKLTTGIFKATIDWVKANGKLIQAIVAVGLGLTFAGAALVAVGGSVVVLSIALSGLATLFGVLMNPIALVVGAIVGLATWFATATDFGRKMVSSLAGWFGDLRDIAVEAFGGIADALSSGDFLLAARVAMAEINLAWLEGTESLRNLWSDFKDFYLRTTTEMVFGALRIWTQFKTDLLQIWAALNTAAQITGETIGHFLTRSSDPELREDQDRAHNKAVQNIKREGSARVSAIGSDEERALAEIEANRRTAEEDRNRAFNQEIAQRRGVIQEMRQELGLIREQAAEQRKERELKGGPAFEPKKPEFNPASLKREIFTTFSLAALSAQGGRRPEDKVAKAVEDEGEKQRRQAKILFRRLMNMLRDFGVVGA